MQCLSFPAPSSDQSREVIISEDDNIIKSRISVTGSDSNTNADEPESMIVETESTEQREDSSNSNELHDADPIASKTSHELKADGDQPLINRAVAANREDCDEHSCAMYPHADPSTLHSKNFPTSDIRNQFADQSEEFLHINTDLDAVQSTDEHAEAVVTPFVSENSEQEQNSLENKGG